MKAELKSPLKTREQKWADVVSLQVTRNHAESAWVVLGGWLPFTSKPFDFWSLHPEPPPGDTRLTAAGRGCAVTWSLCQTRGHPWAQLGA